MTVATQELSARPLEWNPPRQAISQVPYLPGLDGMRALAVVAVIIYHTNNGWLPGGFIGVEVFFVISGYLITLLLIGEHEKTGRINLKQFWMRRARRLLPALFLMMTLLMIYSAIFERDTLGKLRGDVIAGVGYVTNWYQIWIGAGYTALLDFAPLRHLWSLAVEEQFYLFWPLIMLALMRLGRRRLPEISRWLVLAAVLIAVVTGLLYHPGQIGTPDVAPEAYWSVGGHQVSKMDTLYLSTITRATGLLLGAALAMIWRPVAVMRGPMRNKGPLLDLLAVIGLGALGALAWFLHVQVDGRADPWLFRGGFLGTDFATLLVIVAVTHRGAKMGMFLGAQPLNWIGTRSVRAVPLSLADLPDHPRQRRRPLDRSRVRPGDGADLHHHRAVVSLRGDADPPPSARQVVGPGPRRQRPEATPAARRRRRRLRRRVRLRRREHGHRPVEAERGAGDARRSRSRTSPTSARSLSSTTVAAAAPTSTVGAADDGRRRGGRSGSHDDHGGATTTAPQAVGRYLAIGDSVMAGAASPLKAAGFTVDAVESRQFGDYLPTVGRRRTRAVRSPRSWSSTSGRTATSTRTTPASSSSYSLTCPG